MRFACAVGLAFLVGCGGDWGTVSGTVTVDGAALDEGVVNFHPVLGEGVVAYGSVAPNGGYSVKSGDRPGLKPGDYVVTVTKTTIPEPGSGKAVTLLTPSQYASPKTSDLKVSVTAGSNRIPLELKTKSK